MPFITQQIRQANIGRKILRDWKVDGCAPVPIAHAQARAYVCLKCPLNESDEHWIWDRAKAVYISRSLELRRILNIRLEGDQDLHTCAACGCVLKLKVHTPMPHLLKHTPPKEFEKYPDFCWMKAENNNHTTT